MVQKEIPFPIERAEKNPTERLVEYVIRYYAKFFPDITFTLPRVILRPGGAAYRKREHVLYLPEEPDLASIMEEVLHSLVAQFPERDKAYNNVGKLTEAEEREPNHIVKLILKCRRQVLYYNTEEFLARYAFYHFLSNPENISEITKTFGVSAEQVLESLIDRVDEGCDLMPKYDDGFSQSWFHAWGYLLAAGLFLSEENPDPNSLFNLSDVEVESLFTRFQTDITLNPQKITQFSTKNPETLSKRMAFKFSLFDLSQNRLLNPKFPEDFKIWKPS